MSTPIERWSSARGKSPVRILWSVVGAESFQIDRLSDLSPTGAFIATETVARIGDEIRLELLDEVGGKLATGLARIVRRGQGGVGIAFTALGVDAALIRALMATTVSSGPSENQAAPGRPPKLPGVVGGPPPMPGEHLLNLAAVKSVTASRPPAGEVEEIEPQIEPLTVRRTGIVIGIDLGTTNTCASYVVDGMAVIIPGRTGTNTIPSMITFDADGTFHVGQRAADRQVMQPLRTVYGSKRLLGRTYRPDLAAELQKHFAYPLAEAEDQRFGVRIDNRVISMDAIAARLLEEVRSTAEAFLGQSIEAAVITVPAYFTEVQREAVRRAAKEAKLTVHRVVNEPTAAAVAYGHKQRNKARIAVWDFGGGTFDFSIVDVTDGHLEVLATGGDCFVGGSDFDDLLAWHLISEFQRTEGIQLELDPRQIARLREASELAKRALSAQTEYVVELPELTREPKRNLRVEVTRERFEELTKSLVERTVVLANEVMASRGLTPKDINDVVLVGGTTRLPSVQRAVADLFKRRPSKRINPDEAVALGAAFVADEIGSSSGPTLLDILPMSVGRGLTGLRFEPIVPRNGRLPALREVTLSANPLGSVAMPLFQGESPLVSNNEYLCSAVVEDPSLKDGGSVILRLSFDEHCVMAVDARDARSGRPLALKLDRTRPIDEILRGLGKYDGPVVQEAWQLPNSGLGAMLGKLFKRFVG